MNTPAHAVLNLLVLGRRGRAGAVPWIAAGAILPDLPAMAFYAWERLALARPERLIWSQDYFQPRWQATFDAVHSLPLLAVALASAWAAHRRGLALLLASMLLHSVADLPLHGDDAHRHFFPFSDWRFESPVSYWDAARFGWLTGALELALVVAGTVALWRRHRTPLERGIVGAIAAGYAVLVAWALAVWG